MAVFDVKKQRELFSFLKIRVLDCLLVMRIELKKCRRWSERTINFIHGELVRNRDEFKDTMLRMTRQGVRRTD